jgi:NAD(P)-dependent dehydrogenase (short-subunit alcohol dehydrogenase family)
VETNGLKVLVTGGARRIGRAICLGLAEQGAHVAVHFHTSEDEAREVAEQCPGSVLLQADLSDAGAADDLVQGAAKALGGLDVLVNNASVYDAVPALEINEQHWQEALDINLTAPFFLAQSAGKLMRASGRGLIVNLTDWAVDRPYPAYLAYYAAKAGLASLTSGLARALAPEVRVNAIAPGAILPPEGADDAHVEAMRRAAPLLRMGGADSVVSTVMFLVGNDFVTGETITVDGGRSLR